MSARHNPATLDNVKKKATEKASFLRTITGRNSTAKQMALAWQIAGEKDEPYQQILLSVLSQQNVAEALVNDPLGRPPKNCSDAMMRESIESTWLSLKLRKPYSFFPPQMMSQSLGTAQTQALGVARIKSPGESSKKLSG